MLMLAGFAPPQPGIDLPESVQQVPPKGWIPERAPDKAPPVTLNATPQQPSAYRHSTDTVCQNGLRASSREFVESYMPAQIAIRDSRFNDAVGLAEIAAQYARHGKEWMAIERIRIIAFAALKNDAELVASLEAALSSRQCLAPELEATYRLQLNDARSRLGTPR
jgi:hypothetical protein